uniref:Uncharacterized protein n=1 Tax=Aplanochytrium stocchinoi TaxID=215587 RepID=A0A7S3PEN3_9STRA|mmetsp:Transcript_30880/g.38119  ORF Transcript_30880/g.38119 Transcript_30880/m.38119 type:complete len:169 (+) Transcript_30880:135-641(+)
MVHVWEIILPLLGKCPANYFRIQTLKTPQYASIVVLQRLRIIVLLDFQVQIYVILSSYSREHFTVPVRSSNHLQTPLDGGNIGADIFYRSCSARGEALSVRYRERQSIVSPLLVIFAPVSAALFLSKEGFRKLQMKSSLRQIKTHNQDLKAIILCLGDEFLELYENII